MNDLDALDAAAQQSPILAFLDRIERRPDFVARRRRSYELLTLSAGSRVADIGCGAGTAVLELAAHVAPSGLASGVDTSADLIKTGAERAARMGVEVAFHVGSVEALPFETASLKGYRAERLYQHLSQPALALAEARRVLAPGGRIVLVDQDWDALIFDSDDTATTRAMVRGFSNGIINGVIGRQYHRLLNDAGFEDVKVYADACTSTRFAEYGFFAELLAQVAEATGVVSSSTAAAWLADQRDRGQRGRFFMMMTHFLATGRR
jgi:ubiquinone/menaquinone biosynthesis C-methylase UbiE